MKHFNVVFEPDGQRISIHAGATLLEAAGQAGIVLNSVCGGSGSCGKCVVNLEPGGREVLACQWRVQSDLTVTVPQSSRFFEQKILSWGIDRRDEIQPDVYKKYLKIASAERVLGVAVDIGTTSVVARLINMSNGQCLATQAAINPQTKYGDDVISRISYARTDVKLAELHKTIIECVSELIARLCRQAGVDVKQIYEMSVVGNTTMNHIFLKFPITQLGRAPYRAFSVDAKDLPARDMALHINPAGNIHTVENIAGFVGSDIVAVALAVDIDSAEEITLAVDIGTNGEIILGSRDKLYAASCAAGPAFEGARISCGSRAAEGAIEAVVINGDDIALDVIGDCPPRSICGSGLIDAVAVLLDLGIVEETGRFAEPGTLADKLSPAIVSRIRQECGQPAFVLTERQAPLESRYAKNALEGTDAGNRAFLTGQATSDEGRVVLTQEDIRQVQLAKAAIRAGIRLLQKKIGLEDCDIKRVFLAGAFGSYIRRESALRIGLLPAVPAERIIFVGNAASSGAQMILLNSALRAEAEQLARKIEYVEIAHEPDFQAVFAESMSF